jgi:hypothetical protein
MKRNELKGKELANFDYRFKKKIKKVFGKIKEINAALNSMPEKKARKLLSDDMVNDIFTLTETMLAILDYASVVKDPYTGSGVVLKTGPAKAGRDGRKKYEVFSEPAASKELARQLLFDDHLDVMNHLMDKGRVAPPSELPDSIVYRLDSTEVVPAQKQMNAWGRTTLRDWRK